MSTTVKNIDSIMVQAIHRPSVDSIPLYTRIDGTQEKNFDTNNTNKSSKWERVSGHTYSSPTNIRKVFMSGTSVYVQLYKPNIIQGKPDAKGCWRDHTFSDDNSILKVVTDNINYSQNMSRYYMDKQMNPKAKAPDRVNIKGTGLGSLSSPWVCSNVEEVYFDWTFLASEIYRNAGIGCEELLNTYIRGQRGFQQSNLPTDMFVLANSNNIKDLRNRYPRLRCIGLISELGNIMKQDFDKGKPGIDSIEDSIILWSKRERNVELIKQSNSLIIINELKDIPTYNTNFSLRDGIYKFDATILSKCFNDYTDRVKTYLRDKDSKETDEVSIDEVAQSDSKSELEIMLDDIATNRSLADAKSVLLLTLSGEPVSNVNNVFNDMSTAGAKKYRALIGG